MRKLSTSLPRFRPGQETYTEKDKPGRIEGFRVARIAGRMSRKLKLRLLFVLFLSLLVVLWYTTRTFLPRFATILSVAR